MADKPVRAEKGIAVAELTDHFRSSSATVLTEYRGLTVAQLKALRRSLGPTTTYAVTKNTLAKRAATDAGIVGLDELFTGPTALAFVSGDVVEAAKGLRDFAKANPFLVIKGGVFEGRPLSAAEVGKLADLESREAVGQAGRRDEGQPQQGGGAVPGTAVQDRAARRGAAGEAGAGHARRFRRGSPGAGGRAGERSGGR